MYPFELFKLFDNSDFLGSMIHSLPAWTAMDSSYSLVATWGAVLEKGGILTRIPSLLFVETPFFYFQNLSSPSYVVGLP